MLLSSVAEAMFWTGRYVERAQALARVILGYERLSLDLPASRQLELEPLFALVGQVAGSPGARPRAQVLRDLVFDEENPSTVLGALLAARENLRLARVEAPVELWTTVSALTQLVKDHAHGAEGSVLEALEGVLALGARFEGERHTGMTHDSAFAFLEMGCCLERADMLVRNLRVLVRLLLPEGWERAFDDVRWTGLLRALGLHSAYRRRYHQQADLTSLLVLVLSARSCPGSVAYCLHAAEQQLRVLPRAGQVRDRLATASSAVRASGELSDVALEIRLSRVTELLGSVSAAVEDSYFPRSYQALSPRPEPSVLDAGQGDPRGETCAPCLARASTNTWSPSGNTHTIHCALGDA